MTQFKHTPGDWKILDEGKEGEVAIFVGEIDEQGQLKGDESRWIATTHNGLADGYLIIAAPELLAAAKQALYGLKLRAGREPDHKGLKQDIEALEAAIAKARGS